MFTVNVARAPSHRVPETWTAGWVVPTVLSSCYEIRRNMLGQGPVDSLQPALHAPLLTLSREVPRRAVERRGSGHAAGTPGQPQAQ